MVSHGPKASVPTFLDGSWNVVVCSVGKSFSNLNFLKNILFNCDYKGYYGFITWTVVGVYFHIFNKYNICCSKYLQKSLLYDYNLVTKTFKKQYSSHVIVYKLLF